MGWDPITDEEIQPNKPVVGDGGFGKKVKGNLEYLYGNISLGQGDGIPNGSFEIDSDSDGIPDSWTKNLYPGGAGSYEITNPAHGAKSYKFTHPGGAGNGGGYLESDYIEIHGLKTYWISWILWASVAGIKNIVQVRYFDKDKVELGSGSPETLWSSTSNPTSPTLFTATYTPPATTRYVKYRLIGGYSDTNVAGTTYFDCISNEIANDAVTQLKLKTATGEVSTNIAEGANLTLPGGEYGFYPQLRCQNINYQVTAQFADTLGTTSYITNIFLKGGDGAGTYVFARQRYITASGTEHWVFILLNKISGSIISAWEAPDHPCYGNGDDENEIPHPFISCDLTDKEIILLDMDSINLLKSLATNKRGILQHLQEDFNIDMTRELPFMPRDIDGKRILTEKHPSYVVRCIKPKA